MTVHLLSNKESPLWKRKRLELLLQKALELSKGLNEERDKRQREEYSIDIDKNMAERDAKRERGEG